MNSARGWSVAKNMMTKLAICLCLTGLVIVLAPAPAVANTLRPAGCRASAWGLFFEWRHNCHLGENRNRYVRFAAYVQGMQIILTGHGFYTVSIDGVFGSGTYVGVRLFQNRVGVASDGIVGRDTWTHLMDDLTFAFYNCTPGVCWYTYNSTGVIGTARWTLGDYVDANGHWGPWGYSWDGFGLLFGTNAPI